MARARPIAIVAAGAAALWLLVGAGFANYDALYALLWGDALADGRAPQVDVPLAPTSHPLANLGGALLSVLGPRAAEDVIVAAGFVFLAAAGWLCFRLGQTWFGAAAGVAAAVVLLTREPVVSYGARAYLDLPYLVLVLGALLVEVRRPRAGAPVLALLALAGLLRPEAWLFAAACLLWLGRGRRLRPAEVALALAAPVLWLAHDLVATGDALHSFTGTRENTETLERVTGMQNVPEYLPRRVGEVLREPALVAAVVGAGWLWARERARFRVAAAAVALAVVAFAALAAGGLPLNTRYAFVIAALGAVLAGGGLLGAWRPAGAALLVLFAVYAPGQLDRLDRTRDALALQQGYRDDLYDLLADHPPPDGAVAVANHRLVPLVALATDRRPREVVAAPRAGASFVGPANATVARRFILDPRDPVPRIARAPAGMRELARNGSWVLYGR